MFIKIAATKANVVLKTVSVLALCAAVLIFSKDSCDGALKGLNFCFKVLIPSLFPFMAISAFIVKSGLAYQIGKPFKFLTRALFGLDSSFAPVLVLSVLGGYPVGAKGISSLYKSGAASESEAKKAALFAVCAGPGFLVNFVGTSLYQNKTVGWIILLAQIFSVFILGITINIFNREKTYPDIKPKPVSRKIPLSNAIVEAAADSSKSMLNICAFVVLFSAFTSIICSLLNDGLFENCIMCLLEVCSAVDAVSKSCPIEFTAFAIGFGGLCVHFQIFSALENLKISKLSFFCIRIIQGFITALLTHLALYLFSPKIEVFSTAEVSSAVSYGGTIISGFALIGVAVFFLLSLKRDYSTK